jgi:outer membrane cobalamin receptor
MNHQRTTLFLSALFTVFTCSNIHAIPQDLFSLSLEELMNIKVSSTSYFDQTLMEAGNSVTHVEPARWKELGARNMGELLNTMPSTISPQGLASPRVTSIRGYFNSNSNTGIATRLDDVPINKFRSSTGMLGIDGVDLSALSSVELIRGPGSAMHGTDAFHGVLSLNTHTPTEPTLNTDVEMGTEEYIAGSALSHVSDDKQSVTTLLSHRKLGNQSLRYPYTDPNTGQLEHGKRSNELESTNLIIKYTASPNNRTQLYANGYLINMDANQLPGIGYALGGADMEDQDWSDYRSQINLLKLGFTHKSTNQSDLSVFAYYWEIDDIYNADFRKTFLQVSVKEQREESHWGLQAINRHTFQNGANLAYGYEYRTASLDKFVITELDNDGNLSEIQRDEAGAESDTHSLMLDGRYPFSTFRLGTTQIVYGVRFDEYDEFDLQTSPRLGLIQNIDNSSVVKLLYGHAFRAPNPLERFGSEQIAPNFDLQPEKLNTIELIFQTQYQHWFTSFTLFSNRWHDTIRNVDLEPPVGGFATQLQNTGKNKAYGFEVETAARWNTFRMDVMLSHVRSKNLDNGRYFNAFPDWMLNWGLGYSINTHWDIYTMTRYHHRKQASEVFGAATTSDQGSATFLRTDLVLALAVSPSLTTRMTIRNLFGRDNFYPSYFDHDKGIPDNGVNVSLAATWRL